MFIDIPAKAGVDKEITPRVTDKQGRRCEVPHFSEGAASIGENRGRLKGPGRRRANRHVRGRRGARQRADVDEGTFSFARVNVNAKSAMAITTRTTSPVRPSKASLFSSCFRITRLVFLTVIFARSQYAFLKQSLIGEADGFFWARRDTTFHSGG